MRGIWLIAVCVFIVVTMALAYGYGSRNTAPTTTYTNADFGLAFGYPHAWELAGPRETEPTLCPSEAEIVLTSYAEQAYLTKFDCGDVSANFLLPWDDYFPISVAGQPGLLIIAETGVSVVFSARGATYWMLFRSTRRNAWRLPLMALTGRLFEPYHSIVKSIRLLPQ
jgi:hypothetical protein